MKKFFVCLFAAFALLATSCSKDDDDNSPASKATATVNSKEYTIGDYYWSLASGKYTLASWSLNMENNLYIKLGSKKTGTIAIDNDNTVSVSIGEEDYYAISGEIKITTFDDKNINGTYSGKFKKGLFGTTTTDISGSFSSEKETE